MRKDKNYAFKLRKQNKSYTEISKELNIPKSTLSDWFSKNLESQKIKSHLTEKNSRASADRMYAMSRANMIRWEIWREKAREEARTQFDKLFRTPLFITGITMYWAEGDSKAPNPCRFTNTDPRMISLYKRFLVEVLNIPITNLRITMILYNDLSLTKCMDFWSQLIGVPISQFYKTQFIKGKHPTKRLSNGICMITCGNRQLKEKLLVWIDLLSKKI